MLATLQDSDTKKRITGIGLGLPVSRSEVMPEARALAGIIRRRRERLKLSLNQFADRRGVSRQMLGYIERDVNVPTVDTTARIARAFGITSGQLISEADDWLARQPAVCRACQYACIASGRLKWLNPRNGCNRPEH